MKNRLFIVCAGLVLSVTNAFAQLPPVAQAIYDEAYANDPLIVQYAIDNGAEILPTPDGNSFYIQWFPAGATPSITPLVVSLHGTGGYAFYEFRSWHPRALLHGCGIIALQWYRGDTSTAPNDYFNDSTLYNYIDSALTNISYPSGKALLHGFSRGSARSYALIFNDIQSGKNYFCTTISNAGKVDTTYQLYMEINNGDHGPDVFSGKHWNLFCGPPDPDTIGEECNGLTFTQSWLQEQGAIVDIYIQDPLLGHDGFQLETSFAYKDTILENYLQCFNGTLSVDTELNKTAITIFPNPFSSQTIMQSDNLFLDATLTVYNSFGQQVKQINNISGQTFTFHRDNLPCGLYFIHLTQDGKTFSIIKLVITDN